MISLTLFTKENLKLTPKSKLPRSTTLTMAGRQAETDRAPRMTVPNRVLPIASRPRVILQYS